LRRSRYPGRSERTVHRWEKIEGLPAPRYDERPDI